MSLERIRHEIENLQEGLDVEVKNWLNGLATNDEKAKLAKEIIALSNHGGGYIFIGFDDEGEGHPEIEPEVGESEAFNQDNLAAIVSRYIQPPMQCAVSFHSREGGEIRHPVITVPGKHRTPVWAARASPDERTLQQGKIYIRRPGGASEEARNQDDWEKLLERLVAARQSEQLEAIRTILNPQVGLDQVDQSLEDWDAESLRIWQGLVEPLAPEDARRFSSGYWSFAFEVDGIRRLDLGELAVFVEREAPRYSGWRPFTYLYRDPGRPIPRGDEIQAWLAQTWQAEPVQVQAGTADFWRLSNDGRGFSLRPYQEDQPEYLEGRLPQPEGRYLDWTLPIYRMVEFLKFVEAYGNRFANPESNFNASVRYSGLLDRELTQHRYRYQVNERGPATVDEVESSVSGSIGTIELNLEEMVYSLLRNVYTQFSFTELPRRLVANVTRDALAYR